MSNYVDQGIKLKFLVDGEKYDMKNVPDHALAILKNQAQDNMLAANQSKKKLNKIFIASATFTFLGLVSMTASVYFSESFFALQSLTIASGIIGTAGSVTYLKKEKKIQPQIKVFKRINDVLDAEIEERNKFKEIFPDCYSDKLKKKVKYCILDTEFDI